MKDTYVFFACTVAVAFSVGYCIGADHAETVQGVQIPPKCSSVTPSKIHKVVYDYSDSICKMRRKG